MEFNDASYFKFLAKFSIKPTYNCDHQKNPTTLYGHHWHKHFYYLNVPFSSLFFLLIYSRNVGKRYFFYCPQFTF